MCKDEKHTQHIDAPVHQMTPCGLALTGVAFARGSFCLFALATCVLTQMCVRACAYVATEQHPLMRQDMEFDGEQQQDLTLKPGVAGFFDKKNPRWKK